VKEKRSVREGKVEENLRENDYEKSDNAENEI